MSVPTPEHSEFYALQAVVITSVEFSALQHALKAVCIGRGLNALFLCKSGAIMQQLMKRTSPKFSSTLLVVLTSAAIVAAATALLMAGPFPRRVKADGFRGSRLS